MIAALACLLACEDSNAAEGTDGQLYEDDDAGAVDGGSASTEDGGADSGSLPVEDASADASADASGNPGTDAGTDAGAQQGPRCDQISACAALSGPCAAAYGSQCGSVSMGTFSCGDSTQSASGFHFSDGTSFTCSGSDCLSASQAAAARCAQLTPGGSPDGGAGGGGDAGAGQQPTSVWSFRKETTKNLGGVATEAYHRARFIVDLQADVGCSVSVDSPFYATGATGASTIALTSSQQACLRQTTNCAKLAKVQWGSCGAPGCGSLQAGPVWETMRPACAATLPAVGTLSLRLTLTQLGPSKLDETWEVVTP